MTIKAELLALSKRRTKLLPGFVVEWAANHPESAIHRALEWDDRTAGRLYREWQVRHLIAVHVLDDAGDRQLISLSVDRDAGGYRSVEDIAQAPDLMAFMLQDAQEELTRVRRKYARVKELTAIWGMVDELLANNRKRAA